MFSDNLKQLRERKGLTQAELANKAGVDERTVQRIGSGEVRPTPKSLRWICGVFAIDIETLRASPDAAAVTNDAPRAALPPAFDPAIEALVRLEPVRRAMYVGGALDKVQASLIIIPADLTRAQDDLVRRLGQFLRKLTIEWFATPPDIRSEALLELQGELDDLAAAGVVLMVGPGEQVVLPPRGMEVAGPMRVPLLVASVARAGESHRDVVVPLISEWPRGAE